MNNFLVSRNGPLIRSMQYGTAGKTASRHSLIDLGLPGKLMIRLLPLMPAVCLESMAVGTYCRLT